MEKKLLKIKKIVEKEMKKLGPSHDFSHVIRVYKLSLFLAQYERNVDFKVLKTAALLHDVGRLKEDLDKTGKIDHALLSAEMAEKILRDLNYSSQKIEQIKHCIISHRFKGNHKPKTIEAKILSDADKLDVIGVIGIVRSSCWIGENKAKIYSDVPLNEYIKNNLVGRKSNGRIKNKVQHALNIEYELKLKHIAKRLFTKKAKEIAKDRIKFMNYFFKRLKKEISI